MALLDSFNKRKIAFVGNSFTFFGGCVNTEHFDSNCDDGYFKMLAGSLGDDVTVTNFTWGGASLLHKGEGFADRALYKKMKELHPAYYNNPEGLPMEDFYRQDAVVLQQSGDNIKETYEDARLIMALFPPETRFGFYITTYDAFHSFEPSFEAARGIRECGGAYIPLGHLVDDIINGRLKGFGGALEYNKNSFVVCREHDRFHPNTLTGYLTALSTYCAFTGRDLSDADHSFIKAMGDEYYTLGKSNHAEIISSEQEMSALKRAVLDYCKGYNNL